MKCFFAFIITIISITSFAKCTEYSPYTGGSGLYSWCVNDHVHIATNTIPTRYDLKGVVTDVGMEVKDTWFNTISSMKVIVRLENGELFNVGSHGSFRTSGCQLYLTSGGWDARDFCVGERVEIPT